MAGETDGTGSTAGGGSAVTAAERAYIDLLERRIAQLEAQLKAGDNNEKKTPESKESDEDSDEDKVEKDIEKDPNQGLVRVVVSKFDEKMSKRRDFDPPLLKVNKAKGGDTVIFRRFMEDDGKQLKHEEVAISLNSLKKLLEETLNHLPRNMFSSEIVYFQSPFYHFVWQWDELTQACEPRDTDDEDRKLAREYLAAVMALVKSSDRLESYFHSYKQAGGMIRFSHVGTLFRPGVKVFSKSFLNEWQLFEVQRTIEHPDLTRVDIMVAGFDWDGTNFTRACYRIPIKHFEESMPITNLPCFPVTDYQPDSDQPGGLRMAQLLERGKKHFELCTSGGVHHRYDGPVLLHQRYNEMQHIVFGNPRRRRTEDYDSDVDVDRPARGIKSGQLRNSQIIVDNSSFMYSGRSPGNGWLPLGHLRVIDSNRWECGCVACRDTITVDWAARVHKFQTKKEQYDYFMSSEDRLCLLPPRVLGYSLKLGRWAQVGVAQVQPPVESNEQDFESYFDTRLMIDDSSKKLLKALVQTHHSNRDKGERTDIVEGKGKGLVILLHGPPGVGKTLTAETVALATGKPLMSVSTAEIGLEPDMAERNLTDIFEDAGKWQAVLLMDEADVFLEERRGTRDLTRNALVAVLLRVLEYYEGIIIMTTNRITSLDVAVESRIHLAIKYDDLKEREKMNIFSYFLDRIIGEDNIDNRSQMEDRIKKMVKRSRINGRQIRNILISANLLAKSENKRLRFDHIEEVHEITEQFLDSLKDLTKSKRLVNEGSLGGDGY